MKKLTSLFVLCTLALALVGCGRGKPRLHVYNWADYMDPQVIAAFEKQFGCRVVQDYFESNEAMYAKLQAGGGGYDVVFPSAYMSEVMFKQNMLARLDHRQLPNLEHLDPDYLATAVDGQMLYSVPYCTSFTGIGYNRRRLDEAPTSWRVFGNPALAGRMTLLNDMRETIGAALKTLGYSYNSTDEQQLEEARQLLLEWRGQIAKFDVDEARRGLSTGEFLLVQQYNGDILQLMEENEDIAFAIPEEGTAFATDDMVIPADARNPELAHAFINFLHGPEVCASNMQYISYLSPNRAALALCDPEFVDNPAINPPASVRAKCETIRDLGPDNAKWSKVWDAVKAGR